MSQATTAVNPAVESHLWERKLVKRIAASHAEDFFEQKPEIVAAKLLHLLMEERSRRWFRRLVEWPDHAERVALDLLEWLFNDAEWKVRVEKFIKKNHGRALAFVEAMLKNQWESEDARAETYVELLERKTTTRFFFRALRANARNRLEGLATFRDRGESLETFLELSGAAETQRMLGLAVESVFEEPLSHRFEDQDLLDILLQRRERRQNTRLSNRAKKIARSQRKYRWIRNKKWGRKLGIGAKCVTDLGASPE